MLLGIGGRTGGFGAAMAMVLEDVVGIAFHWSRSSRPSFFFFWSISLYKKQTVTIVTHHHHHHHHHQALEKP
jgi:hypothetical protein